MCSYCSIPAGKLYYGGLFSVWNDTGDCPSKGVEYAISQGTDLQLSDLTGGMCCSMPSKKKRKAIKSSPEYGRSISGVYIEKKEYPEYNRSISGG